MPTPIRWACPTELTAEEKRVAQALHRIGKFYVFLREIRADLFDEAFQAELATVYQPRGTAPVPPALLAMACLRSAVPPNHSNPSSLFMCTWRYS